MSIFDSVVLAGLILLVTIWLVQRIRANLKASCCSTDSSGCAGCSGGCGKTNQKRAQCGQPPDNSTLETEKSD